MVEANGTCGAPGRVVVACNSKTVAALVVIPLRSSPTSRYLGEGLGWSGSDRVRTSLNPDRFGRAPGEPGPNLSEPVQQLLAGRRPLNLSRLWVGGSASRQKLAQAERRKRTLVVMAQARREEQFNRALTEHVHLGAGRHGPTDGVARQRAQARRQRGRHDSVRLRQVVRRPRMGPGRPRVEDPQPERAPQELAELHEHGAHVRPHA